MRRATISLAALGAALTLANSAHAAERLVGARPENTSIEGGLWAYMAKVEAEAKGRADLNRDAALNAYVRDVMCRVVRDYCAELRIYVMERPFMNASMAPNGYTEVWTGLLLRASDEAEVAYVLGHEFGHFVENHSLEQHMAHKRGANIALAATVVVAVAGASAAAGAVSGNEAQSILDATRDVIDLIYYAQMAVLFKFSRAQESESDLLGQRWMSQAGYDPRAAAAGWRSLVAETKASDFKRVRESETRVSIFSSHPLTAERIAALDEQAKILPMGGDSGRERHRAAIRPFLSDWLRDELRRRDFGQTLVLVDRLAAAGEDMGVLNYFRGEAFRLRRADGDLLKARDAYLTATAYPDAPAAAWRQLGDIERREGNVAGARAAYETYLAKTPQADDAWMVQESLSSLEPNS